MCSERDSPLEPFVLPAPGQPELAQLTCGAHLGPPVLTRKQKRPRVNSLVCDRAAVFCAAGPPEALSWMSRLVTQAAKRERELARAHSQRLKQATLSLPGESVSRGFADRGALEGYPSHYTSLILLMKFSSLAALKVVKLTTLSVSKTEMSSKWQNFRFGVGSMRKKVFIIIMCYNPAPKGRIKQEPGLILLRGFYSRRKTL